MRPTAGSRRRGGLAPGHRRSNGAATRPRGQSGHRSAGLRRCGAAPSNAWSRRPMLRRGGRRWPPTGARVRRPAPKLRHKGRLDRRRERLDPCHRMDGTAHSRPAGRRSRRAAPKAPLLPSRRAGSQRRNVAPGRPGPTARPPWARSRHPRCRRGGSWSVAASGSVAWGSATWGSVAWARNIEGTETAGKIL